MEHLLITRNMALEVVLFEFPLYKFNMGFCGCVTSQRETGYCPDFHPVSFQ